MGDAATDGRFETTDPHPHGARRVIAQRGADATRFRDVAAETGSANSTLQYSFGSRDDLIIAALEDAAVADFDRVRQAAEAADGPVEGLRALVRESVVAENDGAAREAWLVWVEYWRAAARDSELRSGSADIYARWRALVGGVLADGRTAGAFRRDLDIDRATTQPGHHQRRGGDGGTGRPGRDPRLHRATAGRRLMSEKLTPRRSDPHAKDAAAWDPPPTLTGPEYCSAEVFEAERQRLFQGGWFCIGRAEEAPAAGSFVVADVAGESVLIVRGEDGALRGFLNVCRHRGSQLCQGTGSVKAIRCPYHAWSYGLDGRLLSTPNVRREERLPREQLGLHEVPVDVWQGFVWLSVAGEGEGLVDHVVSWASDDPFQWERYGVGDLVVGARREYRVAANWKLLIENYNECLHCPTVHPELAELVPIYRRGEVEEEPGQNGNGNQLRDGLTSFTDVLRGDAASKPDHQLPLRQRLDLSADARGPGRDARDVPLPVPARDCCQPGLRPLGRGRVPPHARPPGLGRL